MATDMIAVVDPEALLAGAEAKPVPVPVGELVSLVRSVPIVSAKGSRFGAWECSPGVWRRQIAQAEFCYFIEGEAIFAPDGGGAPIHLRAGQGAFFPANSIGVWTVLSPCRKVFIVFDETQAG